MNAPRPPGRPSQPRPESPWHKAFRRLGYLVFLGLVGLGVWGTMVAGQYAGFPLVLTGLIVMVVMLYISLVLDQGPPEMVHRPTPEAEAAVQAWLAARAAGTTDHVLDPARQDDDLAPNDAPSPDHEPGPPTVTTPSTPAPDGRESSG